MASSISVAGHTNQQQQQPRIFQLLNTEIRHIEASKLKKLSAIIDKARAWEKLLGELTRPNNLDYGTSRLAKLNLSLDAISLIEQQLYCGKSPTLALLNHWAITGRRRPTVRSLLGYLRICQLKWAEDYVCQSILGTESVDHLLQFSHQPIKQLQIGPEPEPQPEKISAIGDEFKFDNLAELVDELETKSLRFSFESIYESTNRFCHKEYNPTEQTGTKIGEGRFSSVFRARAKLEQSPASSLTSNDNGDQVVAAKLLKSECNKKYLVNEINLIAKLCHVNVLELLGIALGCSSDGCFSYICLIYPYMQNGSLLDCLSLGLPTKSMEFLTWRKRIDIAVKIARGIAYLHGFKEGPIIHRDIKTANIFIDVNLEPKVGDFTLVRQLDSIRATETQFSQNVIGTSVYMPPEAFRGDISIKFDTFSYGVVLLELLTGLRPFNEELDEDLLTQINEGLSDIEDEFGKNGTQTNDEYLAHTASLEDAKDRFLKDMLDEKAGEWDFKSSKILFGIALKATESRKKNRPVMTNILHSLENVQ